MSTRTTPRFEPKTGDIVVSLWDMVSLNDPDYKIRHGRVDMIRHTNHISTMYSISFYNDIYFHCYNTVFRPATAEEAAKYRLYGGVYHLDEPIYRIGDWLKANTMVTTVDGDDFMLKGETGQIKDFIYNKKAPEQTLFWFEKEHKGMFKMSDNFTKLQII